MLATCLTQSSAEGSALSLARRPLEQALCQGSEPTMQWRELLFCERMMSADMRSTYKQWRCLNSSSSDNEEDCKPR